MLQDLVHILDKYLVFIANCKMWPEIGHDEWLHIESVSITPSRIRGADVINSNDFEKIEILLVDDREENLIALEAVLSRPDYTLVKVRCGEEALRYLLGNTPALILMDVQMPTLNGFETASLIKSKERTRDIPIIFVTAISKGQRFVQEGYDHGAVDYVYKPYDAHVLRSKVAVFAEIQRQHARIERLVAVQRAATAALGRAGDVNAAVTGVLQSICTSLRWDVGVFWKVDERTETLRCRAAWHAPSSVVQSFVSESYRTSFSQGKSFIGRVWSNRGPLWISDLSRDADSPRLGVASREGMQTAVGVPISVQEQTLGVLELYSRKKVPEDSDLIRILWAIGSQIGQVLKRTEAFEMARASDVRKAAVLEAALDCIVSTDDDDRIVEFNPAAERVFGLTRAEAVGREMVDSVISPVSRDCVRGLKRYLSEGDELVMDRHVEVVAIRADGTEFPAELAVTRVPSVEPPFFTSFFRDIIERKKAERDSSFLVEASATLASSLNIDETFSSIAALVVRHLADWCMIDVLEETGDLSSAAVAHADLTKARMAAELREKFPLDRETSGVARVLLSGASELHSEVSDQTLMAAAKDAEHLRVMRDLGVRSVMIVPLISRGKTMGTITLVSTDAARTYTKGDLTVAEELARRAAVAMDNSKLYREAQDAIQSRDEFFSIASHELKTPITSIQLLLQLAQRGLTTNGSVPPVERLSKLLSSSSKQVRQLDRLVDDLLDVVKIRSGQISFCLEETDLSELVTELTERYSSALAAAKCDVKLKVDPEIKGLWDRIRIEQVIVNLLSNAAKYAPGAPVEIELKRVAGVARLVVRDWGPGIARERQAKIFERFERVLPSRNVSGLGLGLFIVKQIVEGHEGTIRLESEEGVGSAFVVELPTQLASQRSYVRRLPELDA
jgi:PAS domain S-box-containing protein